MPQPRILLADDEVNILKVLSAMLRREGYDVHAAQDGVEALKAFGQKVFDAVITDLKMPGMDGMTLLREIAKKDPDVPVIIITAHGTVDTAVEALKTGAFDYITKPFEQDDLKAVIAKALKTRELRTADQRVEPAERGRVPIIGTSAAIREVHSLIARVAGSDSTVLITGESGTGKELVAAALHAGSPRAARPFIKINCAAIPRELMESELFGHERGAFTGAVASKPGRFELADGGTLFLDEIGDLPLEMQAKLLRVLQEAAFERVGGLKTIKVDVRLIAASNRDLQKDIEAGKFRDDLYYRVNVVPIEIPALRERRDDIPLLTEHFVDKYNRRHHKMVQLVTAEAMNYLVNYPWPGNVRELENLIERLILLGGPDTIAADDLPEEIVSRQVPPPIPKMEIRTGSMKDIVKQATAELERDLITRALDETGGNVTRAAQKLGISRKSVQIKMKELGLRDTEPQA
ncbi:MAG: sigma-54-dependent Fis family transcriptional regulator [Deltaproteobacteria bacterium]|nr:sigma-54-dependent Fis family transcriptional regulator [Deltaproteobacteria bacterium]